jgi:hypothetical protein
MLPTPPSVCALQHLYYYSCAYEVKVTRLVSFSGMDGSTKRKNLKKKKYIFDGISIAE